MTIGQCFFIPAVTFAVQVFCEQALAAPSPLYRMSQLEEAKKAAQAQNKPIAWIATFAKNLAPYDQRLTNKGSHAATAYAIRALQNDTILVTSDSGTENHQEPPIVDQELHTPDPHYKAPVVVILTSKLDRVITKILYIENGQERIQAYTEALKKIRDPSSWGDKK